MKDIQGQIFFGNDRMSVQAHEGETLLQVLRRAGLPFPAPCGGGGTCGNCRVTASGLLSEMTPTECAALSDADKENHIRLACQCRILGSFIVCLRRDELHVETAYRSISYDRSPMVRSFREENTTSFYMDDVCLEKSDSAASNLGIAVDIGTTTVALYLCDQDLGRVISSCGFRNPQASYGADVISRIDKIMKDPTALAEQHRLIMDAINDSARALCNDCGVSFSDVRAAVICGNTVMEHIAAGIDPTPIANFPFEAPTLFGTVYEAHTINLLENENAVVYFAPCFASYVGGDITCGILASGLDRPRGNVLFVDVGTNGEIALSTPNGLFCCSAAAGPAFEGAHIRFGMPGTTGAVSQVKKEESTISISVIGETSPIGICGSGIISAVATMLDCGILDETGRIAKKDEVDAFSEYLAEDRDGDPIFWIDKTNGIYMTGKDIREVQLAKAAICAGIRTLLREAGLQTMDVSEVVLAGGFGAHMDKYATCRIGLIPRELEGKVTSSGNMAGAGAVSILLSQEPRRSAKWICKNAHYTELSTDPYFMEVYVEEMMFES